MILLQLPNELIFNIINKCCIGKQRELMIINKNLYYDETFQDIKNKIIFKILRIKLWLKLVIQKRKLFRDLNYILNHHFTLNYSGMLRYKDICLFYSPHMQYGPCRFCMKNLDKHKYYKMMNIYLELTFKNQLIS